MEFCVSRRPDNPIALSRRRCIAALPLGGVTTSMVRAAAGAQDAVSSPAASPSIGWSDDFSTGKERLNVATTVAPISSIVRNIGGTSIALRGIIPDGSDSHTFEPAPSDAKLLASADLVIANGLDLEDPTLELARANLREGGEVITLGDQTISPDQYAYDFSFPKEKGHPNPHLWPNVPFAMTYAKIVAATLEARTPADTDYFGANLVRYQDVLDRLDRGIMDSVRTIPEGQRKLLTYHDSWAYFAQHYGMTVIGAAQPSDFSEPSPQEVARLIEQIRAEKVPAVFGSEVFPSDVLAQIAREAGATYVDKLRDDEPPGDPGAPEHTYLGMMLTNMTLMIPALGGNVDALSGIEPYDTYQS